MRAWLEEFLTVTDQSLVLQIKLVCIPVRPSLILMAGAFMLGGSAAPEPYARIIGAVREATFYFYLVAALIAFVTCVRTAAKEYRGIHKRLFG